MRDLVDPRKCRSVGDSEGAPSAGPYRIWNRLRARDRRLCRGEPRLLKNKKFKRSMGGKVLGCLKKEYENDDGVGVVLKWADVAKVVD